jgi:hypothetical protein
MGPRIHDVRRPQEILYRLFIGREISLTVAALSLPRFNEAGSARSRNSQQSAPDAYHRIGKPAFARRQGIAFADLCKALRARWRGRQRAVA